LHRFNLAIPRVSYKNRPATRPAASLDVACAVADQVASPKVETQFGSGGE
jgi:hypothetical protein